jgi:Legionella pneumophila major outer membrane protein precursor
MDETTSMHMGKACRHFSMYSPQLSTRRLDILETVGDIGLNDNGGLASRLGIPNGNEIGVTHSQHVTMTVVHPPTLVLVAGDSVDSVVESIPPSPLNPKMERPKMQLHTPLSRERCSLDPDVRHIAIGARKIETLAIVVDPCLTSKLPKQIFHTLWYSTRIGASSIPWPSNSVHRLRHSTQSLSPELRPIPASAPITDLRGNSGLPQKSMETLFFLVNWFLTLCLSCRFLGFLEVFMKQVLLALLAASTLSAQFPSNERCWEVGGDLLYWKACAPTYDYAYSNVETPTSVAQHGVKPGYDAGFRIYARTDTHDCCHCWWASWTHFDHSDRDHPGLGDYSVLGKESQAGIVKASMQHLYDKAELKAGRYVSCHCNSRYYAFGSVGYLNIERKQSFTFAGEDDFGDRQKSSFEGGFVQIGAGAEVEEPCNLRLLGHFAAVAGIGKRKLIETLLLEENQISISHPSQTTCIPGLELRVAVEWRYHCSCVWFGIELGYQLDHYFDALRLSSPQILDENPNLGSSVKDIGFGGPFLGVKARF